MCRCLMKFVLFFVNLIFLLISLLIIAGGVVLIFQLKSLTEVSDQLPSEIAEQLPADYQLDLDFIPYVIIGLGSVIFLISFCGCCGAITETKCLLIPYACFMGLLAAAKIVITILLFVKLNVLTQTVENTVNDLFMSEDPYQNATFHFIEYALKCCGTTGPEAYVNDYNLTAPTCCPQSGNNTFPIDSLPPLDNLTIDDLPTNIQQKNQPVDLSNLPTNVKITDIDLGDIDLGEYGNITLCTIEESYPTGCTTMITDVFKTVGKFLGIGLIIVIVFELFAMFFSIFLIKTMKPKVSRKYIQEPRYYY